MAKKGRTKKIFGVDGGVTHGSSGSFDEDDARFTLMSMLAHIGVTADEYAAFLKQIHEPVLYDVFDRFVDDDMSGFARGHIQSAEDAKAIPDADSKTLRLKIKMKDVSKPPMWREVEIPADFNFTKLHYVIQAVMGLDDAHLWQFQRTAYNPDLQIGVPQSYDDAMGLEEWTHDAGKTPVTAFLAAVGDKLEYVYDFGDDWVFVVSVVAVIDRNGDVAICTKWKGDLQPIEDSGGAWSYMQLRDAYEQMPSLKPAQRKKLLAQYCFDSVDEFTYWIDEHLIDIEFVRETLAEI